MKKKNIMAVAAAIAAAAAFSSLTACGGKNSDKADSTATLDAMTDLVETVDSLASSASDAAEGVADEMERKSDELADKVAGKKMSAYDAAFFAKAGNKADKASAEKYAQTNSGLKYVVVEEGTGKKPSGPTDVVLVHYTGRLLDGTVFDSSVERGEPSSFPLNRVIAGWTEGLQLMKEGGKNVFYLPASIAYGETGTPGGPIPPNAPLIFEVELIKVNPQK